GRLQLDRDEDEGCVQAPAVQLPDEGAERQVEVVGAGLFLDGPGLERQGAQPGRVRRRADVRVGGEAAGQGLLELRRGQVTSPSDATRLVHRVDVVRG